MAHIGLHHRPALDAHQLDHRRAAGHAGGHLGLQVGDVLVGIARRPVAGAEQGPHLGLEEAAVADQQHIVDQHPLLLHAAAHGGHGARRDPADVGMVTPGGDEGEARARPVEHRHDHGHVGQVRAAVVGRIQHVDVAGPHPPPVGPPRRHHRPDAVAHGAQMHRHVRRIGDQGAVPVEQGAGEVQSLLDVHRIGRVLQSDAHLLGDGHEQVVEQLQADGIEAGVPRLAHDRGVMLEDQDAARLHPRPPAGLDHGGGGGLPQDGGTVDTHAGAKVVAVMDGR